MSRSREYFKALLDRKDEWFCKNVRSWPGKVEDRDIEVLKRLALELMVAGRPLSPDEVFKALEGFAYENEIRSVLWGWIHLGVIDLDTGSYFILGRKGLEIMNKKQ